MRYGAGEGFAMTEVTSRTVRAFVTILLMPFFALVLTPRMRPFRWSRLLLTYLLPLIPFVVLWDGLVSCFRTRTPQELLHLTTTFPGYDWTAGYAPGRWLTPVYLIGQPKQNASCADERVRRLLAVPHDARTDEGLERV